MSHGIKAKKSVGMAIHDPSRSYTLLAKTLASVVNSEDWIDRKMKKMFCVLFVSNLIDQNIENEVDVALLEKIKKIPFVSGIRLLKRNPDEGLKVLVALVTEELRNQQEFTHVEQFAFFNELFGRFFPENKSDKQKDRIVHYKVISGKPQRIK